MKLAKLGEFGLIERIRRTTPRGRGVLLGIGDDAAWLEAKNESLLVTTDLLAEGVHFSFKWTSPYALGYKTLAVNLSDIAAMGGIPAYLILSLGIPVDFKTELIEQFYRGLRKLSAQSGVALVGGDTSAARSLFISAALIGHAPFKPVRRAGAMVGDDIYVTGTLGDSALGFDLLKRKVKPQRSRPTSFLISRHHFPTARLQAGAILAREKLAKAMIDVSDGLLQDLGHLCHASSVGAILWEEALPLSRSYRLLAGNQGSRYALSGGEDYELLFCVRRRDRSRLKKLQRCFDVPITRIGCCAPAREGIKVIDRTGERLAIKISGHDHFKTAS